MTANSAKDLLAQADQLMRGRKGAEELPVLTERIEDRRARVAIDDIPALTDRVDPEPLETRPSVLPAALDRARSEPAPASAPRDRVEPELIAEQAEEDDFEEAAHAFASRRDDGERVATFTREQFDAAVAAKIDQMGHSVYSQVMQQLELHATGEMKRRLREALEPALMQVALDIAAQVADETSNQIQSVVTTAVESEVTRLREQIQTKRREMK